MRDNIEQASAFKIRHTAPQYSILTVTLTASYTIAADSPNVLFLDGGVSARDVYLPAIVPGGGQEIKIFNTGAVDLTIRDAGGVSIVTLSATEAAELNSYTTSWKFFKQAVSGSGAPTDADYLVKTANAGLTAERVVTDGAAAGTAVWDWSVAGTVKASLYASAADKMLYSTGANAWAEAAITAAGRALIDDANAAAQLVTLGAAASGANTDITSLYLNNTGLKIKDTNASHGLIIAPGSDITADRTLTVTTGDANRTLTISASTTISQDYSSTGNPQFATIELGAASDTTLSRSSAGVIAVEGVTVPLNSITNIHTAQQIELGHASDTTLSRSSAGVLAVEGVTVPLNSTTNIHTAQQIELGHASDTTLTRSAAGVLAVEGVTVPLNSTTNTHTAQQIELGHASDTTLTRSAAGILAVEGVDQARVAGNQNLTGGFTGTSYSGGTVTGSNQTYTPSCANVNIQHITLNGSSLTGTFTFAVPTVTGGDCGQTIVEVVNGGSGAVSATLSVAGYTKADTTAYNTTNGNKFLYISTKTKNYSYLQVVALQ